MRDGYHDAVFRGTFGFNASKSKLVVSIVLFEGIQEFATFMLIVQSVTVLVILLNFLVMEFVKLIDDVAFSLIKIDYLIT